MDLFPTRHGVEVAGHLVLVGGGEDAERLGDALLVDAGLLGAAVGDLGAAGVERHGIRDRFVKGRDAKLTEDLRPSVRLGLFIEVPVTKLTVRLGSPARRKEPILKAYASVAVATGVWLTPSEFPVGLSTVEGVRFSAVELSGAVTHASSVHHASRPDLVGDAQLALNEAGSSHVVSGVALNERDIDGSTVVIELAADDGDWSQFGASADHLVQWAERRLAPSLRSDRASRSQSSRSAGTAAVWLHTILVCEAADHRGRQRGHCEADFASTLLPSEFTSVYRSDDSAFLGWHASLLCCSATGDALKLVRLLDELHAWWTATWTLDQQLLRTAMETAQLLSDDPFAELTGVSDMLAAVTSEVGTIRSRIDTFRLSLGGLEWPVWDAGCRRWELEDNLSAIARKRELLIDMHVAFREAAQARRSARLNQLAGFFAVVSSLASFVAVIVFLFPALNEAPGDFAVRFVTMAISLFLTLVAIFWSSRLVLRKASRRARTSLSHELLKG